MLHAGAIAATQGVRLTRVFDVRADAAKQFAAAHESEAASSIEQMIESGLDGVIISTPPAYHESSALPFLDAGVTVLCEKPLAQSFTAAQRFAEKVRQRNAPLLIAYTLRFHPALVKLKQLVADGTLGPIHFFHCQFGGFTDLRTNHRGSSELAGGGSLADNGVHACDLFRWLVGEPTSIQAMIGNLTQRVDVEDSGSINLAIKDQCLGQISTTCALTRFSNRIEVYGTKGSAAVSFGLEPLPELLVRYNDGKTSAIDTAGLPEKRVAQLSAMLHAMKTGHCATTVNDGLAGNRLISAAYDSARTGKTIELLAEQLAVRT
jgi:predicted dehydrogenase